MGRKAGIYADLCQQKGTEVVMEEFVRWAYPGATTTPQIHDLPRFAETLRAKMYE